MHIFAAFVVSLATWGFLRGHETSPDIEPDLTSDEYNEINKVNDSNHDIPEESVELTSDEADNNNSSESWSLAPKSLLFKWKKPDSFGSQVMFNGVKQLQLGFKNPFHSSGLQHASSSKLVAGPVLVDAGFNSAITSKATGTLGYSGALPALNNEVFSNIKHSSSGAAQKNQDTSNQNTVNISKDPNSSLNFNGNGFQADSSIQGNFKYVADSQISTDNNFSYDKNEKFKNNISTIKELAPLKTDVISQGNVGTHSKAHITVPITGKLASTWGKLNTPSIPVSLQKQSNVEHTITDVTNPLNYNNRENKADLHVLDDTSGKNVNKKTDVVYNKIKETMLTKKDGLTQQKQTINYIPPNIGMQQTGISGMKVNTAYEHKYPNYQIPLKYDESKLLSHDNKYSDIENKLAENNALNTNVIIPNYLKYLVPKLDASNMQELLSNKLTGEVDNVNQFVSEGKIGSEYPVTFQPVNVQVGSSFKNKHAAISYGNGKHATDIKLKNKENSADLPENEGILNTNEMNNGDKSKVNKYMKSSKTLTAESKHVGTNTDNESIVKTANPEINQSSESTIEDQLNPKVVDVTNEKFIDINTFGGIQNNPKNDIHTEKYVSLNDVDNENLKASVLDAWNINTNKVDANIPTFIPYYDVEEPLIKADNDYSSKTNMTKESNEDTTSDLNKLSFCCPDKIHLISNIISQVLSSVCPKNKHVINVASSDDNNYTLIEVLFSTEACSSNTSNGNEMSFQ